MKPWNEQEAREMLAKGISYAGVGRYFGVTDCTAKRRLDPVYAAHVRERTNFTRSIRRGNDLPVITRYQPPPEEDIAARLAEIPPDTRSLTARVFGDPLPGRSALHRKQLGEHLGRLG